MSDDHPIQPRAFVFKEIQLVVDHRRPAGVRADCHSGRRLSEPGSP